MAKGVEIHRNKLRVYFTYEKEKCREPLGLPPTDENTAYAERMVAQINHEIDAGTFEYSRYFPKSKRLEQNRFGVYIDDWLGIIEGKVAYSTFRGYKICSNRIRAKFGEMDVSKIDYIMIEKWISEDMINYASKTIKETLSCLRQIITMYRKVNPHAVDPTIGIRVQMPDDDDPDPFTRDEINKLLSTEPTIERVQELNLLQFLIWTGPRISEGIAIAWEDVDLDAGLIRFRRSCVHGHYRCTKTKRSTRMVELLKPAIEVLREQFELTGRLDPINIKVTQRDNRTIRTEKLRFCFLNSRTTSPHHSEAAIRDDFFKNHCKRAGVRYRGTNQCRHTYISQMLTAKMPEAWISKQAGTSVQMIRQRYGKWITEDSPDMVSLAEENLGL